MSCVWGVRLKSTMTAPFAPEEVGWKTTISSWPSPSISATRLRPDWDRALCGDRAVWGC